MLNTYQQQQCVTFLLLLLGEYFHILFRIIQNIADSRPKVRYIIAKDDAQNTLEEIVKV